MPGHSRVNPARHGDLLMVWVLAEMIADDEPKGRDETEAQVDAPEPPKAPVPPKRSR